jgi:DNA-binding GntR family transcriptional regulator
MVELIQVWAALESMAARLAALHAPAGRLSNLRTLIGDSHRPPGEYSRVSVLLHDAIVELGGSRIIIDATHELLYDVRSIRRSIVARDDQAALARAGDLQIIDALERRDSEVAESLSRQHTLKLAAIVGDLAAA